MTTKDFIMVLDDMCEEIEGALHYMHVAHSLKAQKDSTGDMFYSMAQQELAHAENLRALAKTEYVSADTETSNLMWRHTDKKYMEKRVRFELMAQEYKR